MLGLDHCTVIQQFQFVRDVCSHWLVDNFQQLGGENVICEIDECQVAKRKHNRGRVIREKWVFAIIDTSTKLGFITIVSDRSRNTLLPLIENRVKPGTIIHSDQWPAYSAILAIPVISPFQHFTVNHSENFRNPRTGVHSNNVENMWKIPK